MFLLCTENDIKKNDLIRWQYIRLRKRNKREVLHNKVHYDTNTKHGSLPAIWGMAFAHEFWQFKFVTLLLLHDITVWEASKHFVHDRSSLKLLEIFYPLKILASGVFIYCYLENRMTSFSSKYLVKLIWNFEQLKKRASFSHKQRKNEIRDNLKRIARAILIAPYCPRASDHRLLGSTSKETHHA